LDLTCQNAPMEDERSNGGFSWSPVGQLAADRPYSELPADDAGGPDESTVGGGEERAMEPDPLLVETDPSPPAPAEAEVDPAPLPTFDLAAFEATEVVEPPAPAEARAPAPPAADERPVPPAPAPEPTARRASEVVRPLPRFMAVANQKGGVGKTTTAVNLGAALAELGYRVLVVDLDPQGNATTGLGINARNLQSSIYDVLLNDMDLEDCIEPTEVRNLFLAPATIDLAGAEIELVPAFSRELRLRRALERLGDDYDFVFIDCPPSLGLLTVNGLAAATEVVVPIQCEYYALEGLGQLLRNVELVQRNLNPTLELGAIILTMYDARTKLSDQVTKEVRKHFGAKVCRNIVPRTVRLSEAPSFGQPIIVFDSTSRGAIAYRELAKEVSGGTPRRSG
jgi:chromosome partitioning protein